jgi:glycosyltransferase involved in cell wall biosynthesis
VVATDIRYPREQVVSGENRPAGTPATVAPLAEAPSYLTANAPRRARMGEAGLARALGRCDEGKIIGRTLDLLGV